MLVLRRSFARNYAVLMASNSFSTLSGLDDEEIIYSPTTSGRSPAHLHKFLAAIDIGKNLKETPQRHLSPADLLKESSGFSKEKSVISPSPRINSGDEINEKKVSAPLVWIDLEMTGLDPFKDRILEVACVITDGRLGETIMGTPDLKSCVRIKSQLKANKGPNLVIHESEEVLAKMNDWCQLHHRESGLVDRVRRSTISLKEAEQELLFFVRRHTSGVKGSAQMAGNSVYVDLGFIQHHMPELGSLFSHVVVDVSTVTSLCKRWYPGDAKRLGHKKNNHRALDDVMESIEELKSLKGTIFKWNRPHKG